MPILLLALIAASAVDVCIEPPSSHGRIGHFSLGSDYITDLPHDHFIATSTECPICMENHTRPTTETACKHVFHKACLFAWLQSPGCVERQDACPCCSTNIFLATSKEDELDALLRSFELRCKSNMVYVVWPGITRQAIGIIHAAKERMRRTPLSWKIDPPLKKAFQCTEIGMYITRASWMIN